MSRASDLWNDQSIEKRKELAGILMEQQIRGLKLDRDRIKRSMNKQVREVSDHILSVERELRVWELEQGSTPTKKAMAGYCDCPVTPVVGGRGANSPHTHEGTCPNWVGGDPTNPEETP